MVNGTPARDGEVPWQVILEDMNCATLCGGSIINTRFILSAAHCIDSFVAKPIQTCREKIIQKHRQGKEIFKYPRNILGKQFPNITHR